MTSLSTPVAYRMIDLAADFNRRFFNSELHFKVVCFDSRDWDSHKYCKDSLGMAGRVESENGYVIFLRIVDGQDEKDRYIQETLIHEMAHVSSDIEGHQRPWKIEMRRLYESGAPVDVPHDLDYY